MNKLVAEIVYCQFQLCLSGMDLELCQLRLRLSGLNLELVQSGALLTLVALAWAKSGAFPTLVMYVQTTVKLIGLYLCICCFWKNQVRI